MVATPLHLISIVSCIILFKNVYSYHLSLTPMTWLSASDYCVNYCDSQLASIRTIDQHKITQEIISNSDINYIANNNNPIWIGFNNRQNPDAWAWKNWTWQDGSDTTKFQLWGFLQPDSTSSSTANCVAIDPNTNKWLNAECNETYAFFCNSCDGKLNKLVSPTDTFSTFTQAQNECKSLYETSISTDAILEKDEAEFDNTTLSAVSTQFLIESSENQDCRVYDDTYDTNGALLCDNVMADPGVLCEMPSEICDSTGSQWHTVQGVEMEEYYGVSCGKKINSLYDDSINVIMNKQWKTCNVLKPFVIEMTYSTSNPSTASRTGIVIYPPNEVDKDDENGGFNDHYFIRLHPVDGEIHVGFEKEGIEYLLQDNRGVDYSWGDDQWETLRVEVKFGYMFTIYLNDALVLQTRPYNPFKINMMDVMSGYVGIESIKGDILIKSLYMSGMEVLEDDDTQDYMYNCRFIYDKDVDTTTTTPAPTTSPTTSTTDVPTTTISVTITTTKETATKAKTTKSTPNKATTTTTSTTTTTGSGMYGGPGMYGGVHANVDTNSGLAGSDSATGGNAKQFIVYAIIAAIVCCIIIVGIYYIKLNKKRQREQQLQSVFGRQSRRISRSNDEIAEIVAEAHVMQEGRRSSGNSTSSFDTMPASPPRHLTTQSNQSGMIHMHVVDGFDRPSTVWNNNALHHNNNQRGQLQVQQQAQRPYGGGGHEYYGDDDDDADILNSWDVEALEMDCNNIIKNNKLKSRNRAYSE